jgi:hypothetical protein
MQKLSSEGCGTWTVFAEREGPNFEQYFRQSLICFKQGQADIVLTKQLTIQPTRNQSVIQSHKSINQPTKQPNNQPVSQPTKQGNKHPVNQPTDRQPDGPSERPIDDPHNKAKSR